MQDNETKLLAIAMSCGANTGDQLSRSIPLKKIICTNGRHAELTQYLVKSKLVMRGNPSASISFGSPGRRLYPLHVLYELVEATSRMLVIMLRSASNTANQWPANAAVFS